MSTPSQLIRLDRRVTLRDPLSKGFLGNELRSAFGWALRPMVCVTGASTCDGCPVRQSCAYGAVFDPSPPSPAPHPSMRDGIPAYVVHPPQVLGQAQTARQTTVTLGITLLPPALPHQSVLKRALERAWLENPRLLHNIVHAEDWVVTQITVPLSPSGLVIKKPASISAVDPLPITESQPAGPGIEVIEIRFTTPLRLEQAGRVIADGSRLQMSDLARATHRRLLQWDYLSGGHWAQHEGLRAAWDACQIAAQWLKPYDQQRFSRSQQRSHPMGGLVGRIHIRGPSDAISLLQQSLTLVRLLHIGKRTAFGMGAFDFRLVDPQTSLSSNN